MSIADNPEFAADCEEARALAAKWRPGPDDTTKRLLFMDGYMAAAARFRTGQAFAARQHLQTVKLQANLLEEALAALRLAGVALRAVKPTDLRGLPSYFQQQQKALAAVAAVLGQQDPNYCQRCLTAHAGVDCPPRCTICGGTGLLRAVSTIGLGEALIACACTKPGDTVSISSTSFT